MMSSKVADFRKDVTNKIIAAMEAGTAPWQQPWIVMAPQQNAISRKQYRGANKLILAMRGQELQTSDPRWLTFHQAQEKGWKVKKGSKGTAVSFWQFSRRVGDKFIPIDGDEAGNNRDGSVSVLCRVYTLFNGSQIEGIPGYQTREAPEAAPDVDAVIAATGADIRHGGNKAFYAPGEDFIQLPKAWQFETTEGYYSTALHELTHWTAPRMRRKMGSRNPLGTPDEAYMREELVAELGSSFLCSELGIGHVGHDDVLKNNAAYIQHWVKLLEADNNAIFQAANAAAKAVDFILAFSREEKKREAAPVRKTETTQLSFAF
ncbi:MAG: DUF1738 domain-containing protein [Oscillospiraceae bacterium]|nr:DUF1738 domain-containing protein [Oscillospiraceae bacterium]